MALGDGIRRNIAHVDQNERDRLIQAIVKLDTTKFFPDGVSYWDKQEDIHKNGHAGGVNVHSGPAFIPWHRELCNRFEELLREVDPDLSLHYWDWTVDPRNAPDGQGGTVDLFSTVNFGGTGDPAGPPFQDFESTEPGHPKIWRAVGGSNAKQDGSPNISADGIILAATTFEQLAADIQSAHDDVHGYIGGSIGDAHFSFHDPFVFLLHSNVDRLWAQWQTAPGETARLAPATTYGAHSSASSINEALQPWAGDVGTGHPPLRPWAPPENQQVVKYYKDISIVTPPCYATVPTMVRAIEAENPGMIIKFNDVPEGETAARAAVFEIFACADVTLQVKPGTGPNPSFLVLMPPGTVLVPHGPHRQRIARIWFAFTGGAPGVPVPNDSVTIRCVETGQEFAFTLQANSIARPTVGVMLALDQSGSMDWLAGIDATTKRIDILHQAATNFVQLVPNNNGVGLCSFDHTAHPGIGVTEYTAGAFDPGRAAAITAINNIHPGGATSVGAGLQLARNTLNPITDYDRKALIVFTDGMENTAPMIADVMGSINDRTFAIGLGTAQQVSTGALNALTNNTGGYLLLSGPLSAGIDDYFRLTKYFLQILAGVTNTSIVTDPSGYLQPGMQLRVPFVLNEADIDATVFLLTDIPAIQFWIETPAGDLMDPALAVAVGGVHADSNNISYYRFTLPLPLGANPAHEGSWHAVLEVDEKLLRRYSHLIEKKPGAWSSLINKGVRYSLNAHSLSNLRMEARLSQNSLVPGATMNLRVVLTEYGIPVEQRADVRGELERPDGTRTTLWLSETEPSIFEVDFPAALQGVYRVRLVAEGGTMRGHPFTREQLLSGAVFPGGDNPFPTGDPSGHDGTKAVCYLLECLLEQDGMLRWLKEHGIERDELRRCLREWCQEGGQPSERELMEREGTLPQPLSSPPPSLAGVSEMALASFVNMMERSIGRLTAIEESIRKAQP